MSPNERVMPGHESLSMLTGEAIGHLYRLRKPLIAGLAVVLIFSVSLLATSLTRQYTGTATMAVPANYKDKTLSKEDSSFAGLGLGDFHLLIRSLQDPPSLRGFFPEGTDVNVVAAVIPDLVKPVFASDVAPGMPVPSDAQVLAVEISVVASTEASARAFVTAVGSAVRSVLPQLLEDAWLQQIRISTALKREALIQRIRVNEREREGNNKLVGSLVQIAGSGGGAAGGAREVVDVTQGGHRFLSIASQLTAARVAVAEADSALLVARSEMAEIETFDELVARVNTRAASAGSGSRWNQDLAALLDAEGKALAASSTMPADVKGPLVERVQSAVDYFKVRRAGIDFIQKPSVRLRMTYALPAAVALLGCLAWLVLVFLYDSWKGHEATALQIPTHAARS